MFDVGTIEIKSSDATHPLIYVEGIKNVHKVYDMINRVRKAERDRKEVYMSKVDRE